MKNNLLSVSILLLLLSISSYAQPEHVNFILGGTINYSNNKTHDYHSDPNYLTDQTVKQFMFRPSFVILHQIILCIVRQWDMLKVILNINKIITPI